MSSDVALEVSRKGLGQEPPSQKGQRHHYELYLFPAATLRSINSAGLCSKEELWRPCCLLNLG